MKLGKIILLLVVCCVLAFGERLICVPGVCKRIRCPKIAPCNENQMLIKRATRCRCCSACVPLLNIGDACLRIKRGPTAKCNKGLRCINRRCSEYSIFHNFQSDDKKVK